ncbi:hypothetical protein AB395_00001537 [Sinorhizobium fredii CCBAU 45436]|nr:hypothetical protein AB395_00001537 [Sinorhizobium fredii CCBAU 45436]
MLSAGTFMPARFHLKDRYLIADDPRHQRLQKRSPDQAS